MEYWSSQRSGVAVHVDATVIGRNTDEARNIASVFKKAGPLAKSFDVVSCSNDNSIYKDVLLQLDTGKANRDE